MPKPEVKFLVVFDDNTIELHALKELAVLENVAAIFRVRVNDGQIQINTDRFSGAKMLHVSRNSNLRILGQELYGDNQKATRPAKD